MTKNKRPLCFMVRNKPQSADIIDLVLKEKRAFLGYPAKKHGHELDQSNFKTALCDLSCPENEWQKYIQGPIPCKRKHLSTNRNLVKDVLEKEGSIVLVPRPDKGCVYCGVVQSFELVNNPTWGDAYIQQRKKSGLDTEPPAYHLMDIIQSFQVDEWRAIPMPRFPAWIRKSFFGRSTLARIHPIKIGEDTLQPFDIISILMENKNEAREPTSDVREIKNRLLSDIGPEVLEHMMIGILQYEHADESWFHVGGSGDGGVDGISVDKNGTVTAIVQCKWLHNNSDLQIGSVAFRGRRILASLLHPQEVSPTKVDFYGLERIAKLVLKYSDKLPWARAMNIYKNN